MKLIRKLFNKFARPSMYVTCMITLMFVAFGLFTIICFLWGAPTAGFILLFISALFLGYGAYAIIIQILRLWPRLEKWSEGHKLINRFVMSYDFRTICTTVLVLFINLGFAIFNGVYGFMFQEWWCVSLFIYYLMLIVMRSSISARALRVSRRFDDTSREDAQLRVYRMAAIMLLIFTIALNFLLWELLSQDSFGFRHHLLITIVTGIYTVIKVVMAVSNLIYTRGRHDKITHAIRNINMTDALVSVMTLLMTLLTRFSDSETAVTTVRVLGTIICIYVVAMALFMLINSVVKIKKNRQTLYEMLMDSLNEDFETSLEEPVWEALYATTEYAPVGYIVDPDFALGGIGDSVSDGGADSLEATTGIHDSMLIPPDDLDPGFYKELYAMAGMSRPIPSAPSEEDDEPEEELEPTPLPSSMQHHDEDDGFDDDMHGYVPAPDHPAAPASDTPSAPAQDTPAAPAANPAATSEEPVPEQEAPAYEEPGTEPMQDSEDTLPGDDSEPLDETYSGSAEEEELIRDAEDALTEELAEDAETPANEAVLTEETTSCEAPADNVPADETLVDDNIPADESLADDNAAADEPAEEVPAEAETPAEAPVQDELVQETVPVDEAPAENATAEGTDAPLEEPQEACESPAAETEPGAEEGPAEE